MLCRYDGPFPASVVLFAVTAVEAASETESAAVRSDDIILIDDEDDDGGTDSARCATAADAERDDASWDDEDETCAADKCIKLAGETLQGVVQQQQKVVRIRVHNYYPTRHLNVIVTLTLLLNSVQ